MTRHYKAGSIRRSPTTGLKFGTPLPGVEFKAVRGVKALLLGVASGSIYVPKDTKRISKTTVFFSNRQVKIAAAERRTGEHLSLEQLRARHRTGELSYQSAARREQASKQIRTRERKRVIKRVKAVKRIHDYQGRHTQGVSEAAKDRYWELRERKLAGEWLTDGEFHEMFKLALEIEDGATIARLKQSPDTKGEAA
jgi:hypothetical protein